MDARAATLERDGRSAFVRIDGRTYRPQEPRSCMLRGPAVTATVHEPLVAGGPWYADVQENAIYLECWLDDSHRPPEAVPGERVVCGWLATATDADRQAFPDGAAFHDAHGDDLSECDAWRCPCGNTPDSHGFSPTNDAPTDEYTQWRCDRCSRVFRNDGTRVNTEPEVASE